MRRWLGTATGALSWRPRDFWRSTPVEFLAAVEGWNRAQGATDGDDVDPLTAAELRELMDAYPD